MPANTANPWLQALLEEDKSTNNNKYPIGSVGQSGRQSKVSGKAPDRTNGTPATSGAAAAAEKVGRMEQYFAQHGADWTQAEREARRAKLEQAHVALDAVLKAEQTTLAACGWELTPEGRWKRVGAPPEAEELPAADLILRGTMGRVAALLEPFPVDACADARWDTLEAAMGTAAAANDLTALTAACLAYDDFAAETVRRLTPRAPWDRSAELYRNGARLGFPELALKPGCMLLAGADAWERFCAVQDEPVWALAEEALAGLETQP